MLLATFILETELEYLLGKATAALEEGLSYCVIEENFTILSLSFLSLSIFFFLKWNKTKQKIQLLLTSDQEID